MEQLVELFNLNACVVGYQLPKVDTTLALARTATVSTLPRLFKDITDGDVVLLLMARLDVEVSRILKSIMARRAHLLIQLRVPRQVALGLDTCQVGDAAG